MKLRLQKQARPARSAWKGRSHVKPFNRLWTNQTDEGRGPQWPSFARGATPCALRSASRSDGAVGMSWDGPMSAFCPCAPGPCHGTVSLTRGEGNVGLSEG
jgi:hypothetical protein